MSDKPLRMPQTGTDYRSDSEGRYYWPHPFWQRPGEPVEEFWAVSSVLEILESFGRVREVWQAKHAVELVELARKGGTYEQWDDTLKKMVDVKAITLLEDRKWLEGAGWRELNRAAARGTIVHDVIEEWCYKFSGQNETLDYTDDNLMYQLTIDTIEDERRKRGSFFVDPDPLYKYVQQALKWLDMHVKCVHMAETAVFNRSMGYAGTVDLDVELKNADGLWRIDAKTSASHYDSHRIQLAAYYHAEFAAAGHGNHEEPLPKPDHVANLYIGQEEARLREWWVDKKGNVLEDQRNADFYAFAALLGMVMPRVKPQKGEDGKYHAINPVTVERCTNRAPKKSGESNEPDCDNPNESCAVRSIK